MGGSTPWSIPGPRRHAGEAVVERAQELYFLSKICAVLAVMLASSVLVVFGGAYGSRRALALAVTF